MAATPLPRDDSPRDDIRVVIDVGPLYGHRTGVGMATAGIVTALSARTDVVLDPFLVSFRSTPRPGDRRLPLPGIVASHLWSRADWPRVDRWARPAGVIHGTNYVVPPSRLPSVVTVYDCWFLRHPDRASALVQRAGRRLRRAVANGAYVHVSSEHTAQQARQLLGTDRVVTIPLGLPEAIPTLGELPTPTAVTWIAGRPFVLAIGTEERRKDLPLLVDAFARLASAHADLTLVLVGAAGDASADVTASVAALPPEAAARVLRLGAVDDATKHALLRRASVLAYPSLDEGFGFPILEAQMAATPVVASRVGSIAEVAGDAAVLVDRRDPDDFATALGQALGDGALRLGLIESGTRNLHRFSWDTTADRLVELYRQAIGGSA